LTPEGATTPSSDETKTKAIADEDQTRLRQRQHRLGCRDEEDRPHTLHVQHKGDGGKRHKIGMKGHQSQRFLEDVQTAASHSTTVLPQDTTHRHRT